MTSYNPTSEEALAEVIRDADAGLSIQGGGTKGFVAAEPIVSTAAISGVSLYEPGALTLVAKAGTPIAEIETLLASENQRLAFEPRNLQAVLGTQGAPTLGAMAAMNNSGPARVTVGACRDFMLGVRFVDGAGNIISNGGRVMKNVTGYDLVKFMAGSHGTLGVITEVSLKVLPRPEASGMLVLHGLSDAEAVAAMSKALGSPFEVSGAAHVKGGATPQSVLRVEGFSESVTYRMGQLKERLAGFGDITLESGEDAVKAQWDAIRDVDMFSGVAGNLWRISVKPSDAPDLVASLGVDRALYDWGGGLVWCVLPEDVDPRGHLFGLSGHATLMRGAGQLRFHPETAGVARLSQSLRQKFDPRGILNPGLMG